MTVVAFVLLGLPLARLLEREPYPAIIMPAFPLHNGETVRSQAAITIRFADGRPAVVAFRDILPETRFDPTELVSTTFQDDEIVADPEITEWLRARIAGRFPGRAPAAADIEWRATVYRGAQRTHRPIGTIRVEFG